MIIASPSFVWSKSVVKTQPAWRFRAHRVKRAFITALITFLLFTLIIGRLIEGPLVSARDPEYAARRDRLLARQVESRKPIILCLGSSRLVEGIRPNSLPDDRQFQLLNGGLIGSGPLLELMTYRRLKQDGIKPTHVWLEYWPPLLRGDNYAEYGRIDLPRLGPADWPIVRDYFPDPRSVRRYIFEGQIWPIYRNRKGLLTMVDRKLVMNSWTNQRFATNIDPYGWWPGERDEDAEYARQHHADVNRSAFQPFFQNYSIGGEANRAMRDLLLELHADNVSVTIIYFPESTHFQTLYSPKSELIWRTHIEELVREFDFSFINAQKWDFDEFLPDGVHLTQGGATRFTERLWKEWTETR